MLGMSLGSSSDVWDSVEATFHMRGKARVNSARTTTASVCFDGWARLCRPSLAVFAQVFAGGVSVVLGYNLTNHPPPPPNIACRRSHPCNRPGLQCRLGHVHGSVRGGRSVAHPLARSFRADYRAWAACTVEFFTIMLHWCILASVRL